MANVNVRIDEDTKRQAEQIFESLGLTASTAINLFYKQVIITNSIPFELRLEKPNKKTIQALKEAKRIEEHPEKYKGYRSSNELMEDLLK